MFVIFLPERGSYMGFFPLLIKQTHILCGNSEKKILSIKKKFKSPTVNHHAHLVFSPSFLLCGYRYTFVKRKDADIYDSGIVISPFSSPQA